MRLLFDQNLAPRLTTALGDLFPDSQHVRDVGLARAAELIGAFDEDEEATLLILW